MRKESHIFLIDVDGVACDHATAVCAWVNKKYEIHSEIADVTTWNHDFGPITFVEAVDMCYRDKGFILNMEVTPGFSRFLEAIRRMFTVQFATRRRHSHDATRHWIRKHFGEFDTHFVKRKEYVTFDCLIDDSIEDIIRIASVGALGRRRCFLLKRPWNDSGSTREKLRGSKRIHFVETFTDVFRFLK